MSEQNKAIVRRLFEGISQGHDAVIEELVAPDFAAKEAGEMRMMGAEGFREVVATYRSAFPDMRFTIEDLIAEGDKVVVWSTFTGTHQGPLGELPPTGKSVAVKDVDMYRVRDGKVVEGWTNFDQWGLMKQLGVVGAEGGEEG
ncbi:MAG TPA: ester cyclase [bacterium]|nr:ester cyclase [bacterium]